MATQNKALEQLGNKIGNYTADKGVLCLDGFFFFLYAAVCGLETTITYESD